MEGNVSRPEETEAEAEKCRKEEKLRRRRSKEVEQRNDTQAKCSILSID